MTSPQLHPGPQEVEGREIPLWEEQEEQEERQIWRSVSQAQRRESQFAR